MASAIAKIYAKKHMHETSFAPTFYTYFEILIINY